MEVLPGALIAGIQGSQELLEYKDHKNYKNCEVTNYSQTIMPSEAKGKFALPFG